MTEEPYRWLEAVRHRREYIEEQLQPGHPVVAFHGPPGILLLTVGVGTPKLFEIYEKLALGCVGHPADLEKVRQAAIDAAHLEGFNRSAQDVNARRLINYNLGPVLKNAFEQIFSAPLLFEGVMGELGATSADDQLWTLHYDGSYSLMEAKVSAKGVLVTGNKRLAQAWTETTSEAGAGASWGDLARKALRLLVWARQPSTEGLVKFEEVPAELDALKKRLEDVRLEAVVLHRSKIGRPVTFESTTLDQLLN